MSCTKNMTFEECELEILRNAVDNAEKSEGAKLVSQSRSGDKLLIAVPP